MSSPNSILSYRRVPAVLGFAFAWIQTCLFLSIQIFYSATIIGYFLILGSWLLGITCSLLYKKTPSLIWSLLLSALGYYLLHAIVRIFVPSHWLIPILCLATAITAIPVGVLIKAAAQQNDSSSFLFWENNGFVLGLMASIMLFTRYGVGVLEWAPAFSSVICIAVLSSHPGPALATFGLAIITMLTFQQQAAGFFTLILFSFWLYSEKKSTPTSGAIPPQPQSAQNLTLGKIILVLAGCNAFLLQYFIARSFTAALRANELTFILTGAFYMFGYSIGYYLAPRLPRAILHLGVILAMPLTILVFTFAKPLASQMIALGQGQMAVLVLIFFTTLATSSFYSMLLPRTLTSHHMNLVSGYTWDLFGALIGLVLLIILGNFAPHFLWPLSILILGILCMLILPCWRISLGLLTLLVVLWYGYGQTKLTLAATTDFYAAKGVTNPKVLFAGDSFYHSIDIVESYRDKQGTTRISQQSYLNGIKYFETLYNTDGSINDAESSLSEFTYFLAELPAKLMSAQLGRPIRVLILGGGSLTTIRRVGPFSNDITLVEIDPLVVASSAHYWQSTNRLHDFPQAQIVIDDVRHFLMTTDNKYDLIINDISAPYYLGTALLHSEDFYFLVQQHLAELGVFSESTQSRPNHNEFASAALKILKGMDAVFPSYRLIDGKKPPRGRRGYIYATDHFKLDTNEIQNLMRRDNKFEGAVVYDENNKHFDLQQTTAFSLRNIETLLTRNFEMLKDHLNPSEQSKDPESLWQKIKNFKVTEVFANDLCNKYGLSILVLFLGIVIFENKWRQNKNARESIPKTSKC